MEKYIRTMANHLIKPVTISLIVVMSINHQLVHAQYAENPNGISITNVANAEAKGAVCNDGSPAAYYYDPGFGDGANSWVVFMKGGGWCGSDSLCRTRLDQFMGSSAHNEKITTFGQIHSRNATENPDFYNWNRVMVVYCDSSSFMGTVDHNSSIPGTSILGRGALIFDVVMEELLQKGMANATNVLFSGGSAGGLATLLHCDGFRELFPSSTTVKCVVDSGFFIHALRFIRLFVYLYSVQGFTDKLPPSCTSKRNASLCVFPEYIVRDVKTPLFLLETKFDTYQIGNLYLSDDKNTIIKACSQNFTLCTPSHFQMMKDYGSAITELLQEIRDTSSIGMFVHPCLRHGHFSSNLRWNSSYKLKNKTIAEAVGDWYNDRDCTTFQEIDTDHEFPLNTDCTKLPNM
ncbi:pectinacetylesterase family protein [Striga asiatica]|uniref:Pectin acetylesterase n=1 Tax=Striga asiatica TaxID=4170 RepID=A0A5A7QVI2_STRAF|nr:pectinacetylesterase family protein [Striga asiatica]